MVFFIPKQNPESSQLLGFLFPTHNAHLRIRTYMNYTPKNQLKVDGKMSELGADKASNKLATAAIIASVLFGIAAVIAAIRWW